MSSVLNYFYEKNCSTECKYRQIKYTILFLDDNTTIKNQSEFIENQCKYTDFCCSRKDFPSTPKKSPIATTKECDKPQKNKLLSIGAIAALIGVIISLLGFLYARFDNRAVFTIYSEIYGTDIVVTLVNTGRAISDVNCYLSGYYEMLYCDELLIIPMQNRNLQYDYFDNKLNILTVSLSELERDSKIHEVFHLQGIINTQIGFGKITYDDSYFSGIYQKPQLNNDLQIQYILHIEYTNYNNIRYERMYSINTKERIRHRDIPATNVEQIITPHTSPETFYNIVNRNLPSTIPPFAYYMR